MILIFDTKQDPMFSVMASNLAKTIVAQGSMEPIRILNPVPLLSLPNCKGYMYDISKIEAWDGDQKVLLLDADNICLSNPDQLLETKLAYDEICCSKGKNAPWNAGRLLLYQSYVTYNNLLSTYKSTHWHKDYQGGNSFQGFMVHMFSPIEVNFDVYFQHFACKHKDKPNLYNTFLEEHSLPLEHV